MGSTKKGGATPRVRVVLPAPPPTGAEEGGRVAERPMGSNGKKKRGPAANGPEAIAFRPFAAELLDELVERDVDNIFAEPVTNDIAPGYSEIIEKPMDLTTLRKKLKKGRHNNAVAFQNDVRLIWDNCKQYNAEDTEFYKLACDMARYTEKLIAEMNDKESDAVQAILAERRKQNGGRDTDQTSPPATTKRNRPPEENDAARQHAPTPSKPKKARSMNNGSSADELQKQATVTAPKQKALREPEGEQAPEKKANQASVPEPATVTELKVKAESKAEPTPTSPSPSEFPTAEKIAVEFRAKKAASRAEARAIRMSDPERGHLLGAQQARMAAASDLKAGMGSLGQRYSRPQFKVSGRLWSSMGPAAIREIPPLKVRDPTDPRLQAASALDQFVQASAPSARLLLQAMLEKKPIPESLPVSGLPSAAEEKGTQEVPNRLADVEQAVLEVTTETMEVDGNYEEKVLDDEFRKRGLSSQRNREEMIRNNSRLLRQLRVVAATFSSNATFDDAVEIKLGAAVTTKLVECASQIPPAKLVDPRDAAEAAGRLIHSSAVYQEG